MAIEPSLTEMKETAEARFETQGRANTPSENLSISIVDILIVLAERKRLILLVTVFCVSLATLLAFVLPARYTATVVLLPPQQNSSMSSALASQLGSLAGMAALAGGSLGIKNPNDMYVAMFKGRTVEDAMVHDFGLMREYHDRYLSDARKDLERHATVDGSGKDGLIHISIEDHDPHRAAELANGYVDRFRSLSEHLAITEASQRRLFFEQQLEQAKNNLADAEEALKQTEQKTGLIQLDSQARALIESAASLRAQIAAKEVQIQGMQTYATGQNSQLVEAEQELDGLRAQLAKLGGNTDGSGELIVPKGMVPEAGLEYVRKLRDVKYYETIFDILARQFEIAKLDEAKQGALIQVVDSAVPPDKKSFPRVGLFLLGGSVAGFFVGICFVLVAAAIENLDSEPALKAKFLYLARMLSWKKDYTS
jgi:tyrosine-protein kinase Etk/Wzc